MGWTRATVLEVARRTGYPVVEAWSGHNAGQMGVVYGAMLHHTGTSIGAAGDYPTLKIVRDGRSDLNNSLCMYGLGRSGTIYCISEKLSWHAGAGNWKGVTDGNGHFVGIEAESDGKTWYPAQLDAYQRLVASIQIQAGRDASWAPAHKEYALPAGRKPDPSNINLVDFRNKVQAFINNPATLNKTAAAIPIVGAIRAAYDRTKAEAGLPKGPEVPTIDPVGRWQEFSNGAIYWHPLADNSTAHLVKGDILRKWRELGSERGYGWPVTDELKTPDGVGRFNHFDFMKEPRSIYYHPTVGTFAVRGAIRGTWEANGWEQGRLGYPTGDEYTQGAAAIQNFQKGNIVWESGVGRVTINRV